ncbi:MAG: signal peptidase I, partial [Actinomycetota bacterium]
PERLARHDRPSGEDFWNDPLPPRRRLTGEGRQRDQARTSLMEASPTQSRADAEPRKVREPGARISEDLKPRTTRIAATDRPPSERLEPAMVSSRPEDVGPSDGKNPYATARLARKDRRPEGDRPPQALSGRKARKAAAADRGDHTQSLGQWFKEITILGVVAVGTAVLLTTYLIQAFFIPSGSMENTLVRNDRVLVNKFTYKFGQPQPGDIIVFVSPEGTLAPPPANTPYARFMDKVAIAIGLKSSEQDLIKRVIATEGQTIEARVGLVFVDGGQLVEPYRKTTEPISDIPAQKVPEGHVFVLGDNRTDSRDSRVFGPVPVSSIIGKAFARIWPLERLTWFEF